MPHPFSAIQLNAKVAINNAGHAGESSTSQDAVVDSDSSPSTTIATSSSASPPQVENTEASTETTVTEHVTQSTQYESSSSMLRQHAENLFQQLHPTVQTDVIQPTGATVITDEINGLTNNNGPITSPPLASPGTENGAGSLATEYAIAEAVRFNVRIM